MDNINANAISSASTIKIKKVGTREEVYKKIALRTAGGLKYDDIIVKTCGSKTLYVSKKLSEKMSEQLKVLRITNPNFLKRIQKKTLVAPTNDTQTPSQSSTQAQSQTPSSHTTKLETSPSNLSTKIKQKHNKTQKLSFKIKDNSVKTIFYPELEGLDLKELKDELLKEEAIEDGLISETKPKGIITPFTIEELPDFNINDL